MLLRASSTTLLLAAVALAADRAPAQTYPSKLVTVVVPVAPGGVSDTFARGLAQRLTQTWGQQVIVPARSTSSALPRSPRPRRTATRCC
jgi:tripartite-type tricarboxylate transporter receptor subunit TctC